VTGFDASRAVILKDKECDGRPKLVEDAKLEASLDDPCHTQEELV